MCVYACGIQSVGERVSKEHGDRACRESIVRARASDRKSSPKRLTGGQWACRCACVRVCVHVFRCKHSFIMASCNIEHT
jgi:hypothetical protein